MKNFLIILVSVMFLTGNAEAKDFDVELSKEKNAFLTAFIFSTLYTQNGKANACEMGYLSTSKQWGKNDIAGYQKTTEPNIKLDCFMGWQDKYYNTSDECILARRNAKKSKICWFNYKKYLPNSSKTKTDDEFLTLVEAFEFFFYIAPSGQEGIKNKFCLNKKEITSAEREQCHKDVIDFLVKLDEGKIPNCRDKKKNDYYELLRQGKELLSLVDNTSLVNSVTGYEQQGETILFRAIYSDAFGKMFVNKVKEFGYTNMCSTKGFEQDIKKAVGGSSQKEPQRQGRVVELN